MLKSTRSTLGLASVACWLVAAPARAADPNEFQIYSYDFMNDGTTELPGRLFVPTDYDQDQSYPIVLFYHGVGECGTNNTNQVNGNINNLLAAAKSRRFLLYAPQLACHDDPNKIKPWDSNNGLWVDNAIRMLSNATRDYNIDLSRIYVTGLSLGGGGVWKSLFKYNHALAAGISVCGAALGGSPPYAEVVGKPLWLFHAANDEALSVNVSRNIVNAIRAADGLTPLAFPPTYDATGKYSYDLHELRYTEYKSGGHNIWGTAYGTSALYDWMLGRDNPLEDASLQPGAAMLFDFGNAQVTTDSQGRRWNSVSANYHRTLGAILPFGVTSGGASTSVSLDVKQAFGGHTTAGSTALYEANIGTDGWQTTLNGTGTIVLRGLIPGAAYKLECYGATSSTGRNTRYQVGSKYADLDTTNNTTSTAILDGVQADARGWIELSVSPVPGSGSYGQINTLKLSLADLDDTFFAQDFSSATTVASYVNLTAPNTGQFNDISAEADAGTWSIDSGRLELARVGTSTNGAGLTRFTGPIAGAPETARFRFKLSLSGVNTSNNLASVEMGNITSVADYNNSISSAAIANVLTIKGRGDGVFGFSMVGINAGSYAANGTDVDVSWMVNQSAVSQTYRGLDGASRTLSPGCSDVWVGGTLLFANVPRGYGSDGVKLGGFRIRTTINQPVTFTFDDLAVYDRLPQ